MTTRATNNTSNTNTDTVTAATNNEALFSQLRRRPTIAWPTVMLMVACNVAIFSSWYLVLTGSMALWLGCAINCVAMYFQFSPVHDAIHRSISTIKWFNEACMYFILLPIVPFSNGRLLRVMHMQHHRFANDPVRDPDHHAMTARFKMIWHWFFWDFGYLLNYLRNKDSVPDCGTPVRDTIVVWVLAIGIGIFFPLEVIFLWFIPSRFMAWMIAAVFMYLPHWPHDVRHEDNPYQATHYRTGWDWLLTPLLAWQNYHLVHHLYPTVPFYRYRRIWEARQQWHESHNPSIVRDLHLTPERMLEQKQTAGMG